MVRWIVLILALSNLGLFLWGWSRDTPLEIPLPPLPQAPATIHLAGGAPGPRVPEEAQAASVLEVVSGSMQPLQTPARAGSAQAVSAPVTLDPGDGPVPGPEGGAGEPLLRAPLIETLRERVDPSLLPDESSQPPVVILPVREEDPGPTHTWSRDGDSP